MIGIYEDSFRPFLEKYISPVKIRSKNIIARCPWCEMKAEKKHYHLYISLEAPIFHCFHCEKGGVVPKLLQCLTGKDLSSEYVNEVVLKEKIKTKSELPFEGKKTIIPLLLEDNFKWKSAYVKNRLKNPNFSLQNLKGLVFDVNKFIEDNNVVIDPKLFRLRDYLQSNFVGFLTERGTKLVLRNIDSQSDFRYFKLDVRDDLFLDYYLLKGGNFFGNTVVLAEGIFDILHEYTHDNLNLRSSCKLYAAGLSKSYPTLLKSLVFNEQIFKMNVIVLSDSEVELKTYNFLRKVMNHTIESLTVYYNKGKKDFAETPVCPERYVIPEQKN